LKIHIPHFVFANTSDAKEKDNDCKFGGLPKGLPKNQWPICSECEVPMTFLFQMKHHPERLSLGKEGRVFYLFQCENGGECSTWEADGGCNKAFILEPEDWDTTPIKTIPDEDTTILPEIAVSNWETKEVTHQDEPVWTHFGGEPIWIQSPETVGDNYVFTAQLDFSLVVKATNLSELPIGETSEYEGAKSYQLKVGKDDFVWITESGSNKYYCPFANFGDSGSGYVFVNVTTKDTTGKFIWQCY
jgi:hypothetical protein